MDKIDGNVIAEVQTKVKIFSTELSLTPFNMCCCLTRRKLFHVSTQEEAFVSKELISCWTFLKTLHLEIHLRKLITSHLKIHNLNFSRCLQLYLEKFETVLLIIQDISNLEISKFMILKN